MVDWIVSSSVLVAVMILLRFALRGKVSLRVQYALWGLVLVRLLLPFSVGSIAWSAAGAAEWLEPVETAVKGAELELPLYEMHEFQDWQEYEAFVEGNRSFAITGKMNSEFHNLASGADYIWATVPVTVPWDTVLKTVWAVGGMAAAVWFAAANFRFSARLKRSRRTESAECCRLPVYISDILDTPCLFGMFRPAIYLTAEAVEEPQTMRHAVEHEYTHYCHGDHIWAVLRCVCLALHWYNPLVWWAALLSRNDAELACDEATILRLGEGERAAYGRTLVRLTCEKRPALLHTATTMTGSGRTIRDRIALIVRKPKMAAYTLAVVLVISVFAAVCAFAGAEKNTPWQWAQSLSAEDIRFAEPWTTEAADSRMLSDADTAKLTALLNVLDRNDFADNKRLAGGTPTYGLRIQTVDGTYHINQSIAASGQLEIQYAGKMWWIDDEKLADFVRKHAVTATHSAPNEPTVPADSVQTEPVDLQQLINSIMVGSLRYGGEEWQSSGNYTLTVSGADGRTDSYLCAPGAFPSLSSTPGYYVGQRQDLTPASGPWEEDHSENDYIMTVSNDRFAVTVYSQEDKIKVQETGGRDLYFVGETELDEFFPLGNSGQLFRSFWQYAVEARANYEFQDCSVDGSETNYELIARELAKQYARLIVDRPDWYHQQAQEAGVSSAEVFDAYYGAENSNFVFNLRLYLKIEEDERNYWAAGGGFSGPYESGPLAGYYGDGGEATVQKGTDGRWRMSGLASGGSWVQLPEAPGNASTQRLIEMYFLTEGWSRDWRILSALAERPLAEVQEQLQALTAEEKRELTEGMLGFIREHPDDTTWKPEDFAS
ncbi:MAG: M56 family metallopeptidase [Ruminococcaceae bacterium]|nr:M56 family metallopeptidase [Oscillospiraceae bacterium]